MSAYENDVQAIAALKNSTGNHWSAINPEYAARMRLQNRFKTGLDIALPLRGHHAPDMAAYDADSSAYTQSLGCWHGFNRAAEADRHQEAPGQHERPLPLSVRLDDRRAALGIRPAAGLSPCTRRPACRH